MRCDSQKCVKMRLRPDHAGELTAFRRFHRLPEEEKECERGGERREGKGEMRGIKGVEGQITLEQKV